MEYWFHIDGENVGPLRADEAETLVAQQKITAESWAWFDGLDQWRPVREIPEVLEILPTLDRRKKRMDRRAPMPEPLARTEHRELADFKTRFLAGAIDTMFVTVASAGLMHMTGQLEAAVNGAYDPLGFPAWMFVPFALYYIGLASRLGGGQTLGYRALNIVLVDQTRGSIPSIIKVVLWYLGLSLQIIGWIWYFKDDRRRMLHNLISGTVVVRRDFLSQ